MDEDWSELWCYEDAGAVQTAVTLKLQNYGIKVPRRVESSEPRSRLGHWRVRGSRSPSTAASSVFGVALDSSQQPSVTYRHGDYGSFKLPRFLVESIEFLEQHVSMHGLFRKAGSVARQKTLKAALDSGNASIPEDANVHDVAGLLKQYFRELPEPLITSHLFPVFDASFSLPRPEDRRICVLMACLLLPRIHLQCLCVLMKLLHSVSEVASESLMDASNLAIVLAPNIMRPNIDIKKIAPGNPIKNQTGIAQLLIESAPLIGRVPSCVYALRPAKVIEAVSLAEYRQVKGQTSHGQKPYNSAGEERKGHSSIVVQRQSLQTEVEVQNFVKSNANGVHRPAGLKVETPILVPAQQNPKVPAQQNPTLLAQQNPTLLAQQNPTVPAQQNPTLPAQQNPKVPAQQNTTVQAQRTQLEAGYAPNLSPVENHKLHAPKPSAVEERNHFSHNHNVEAVSSEKRVEANLTPAERETDRDSKPSSSLQVQPKEQERFLNGPLLYAGLIGLLVLVVALLISKVVYV